MTTTRKRPAIAPLIADVIAAAIPRVFVRGGTLNGTRTRVEVRLAGHSNAYAVIRQGETAVLDTDVKSAELGDGVVPVFVSALNDVAFGPLNQTNGRIAASALTQYGIRLDTGKVLGYLYFVDALEIGNGDTI